jgi:hypothetical protein
MMNLASVKNCSEVNKSFLASLPAQEKERYLLDISMQYDISLEQAECEVIDSDAELLFEYMTSPLRFEALKIMKVSNLLEAV